MILNIIQFGEGQICCTYPSNGLATYTPATASWENATCTASCESGRLSWKRFVKKQRPKIKMSSIYVYRVHTYDHMYLYMYMYLNIHIYVYIYIYDYMHIYIYVYIYICVHIVHIYIYTEYIYIYTCDLSTYFIRYSYPFILCISYVTENHG